MRASFDYALIRVLPRVERGEFVNAGAILFCRTLRFLDARISLDAARVLALAPDLDVAEVERYLQAIPRICAGGRAAGQLGDFNQSERFHWLVAPRSAIIQASPVHCGLCDDPVAALDDLVQRLVHAPVTGQ